MSKRRKIRPDRALRDLFGESGDRHQRRQQATDPGALADPGIEQGWVGAAPDPLADAGHRARHDADGRGKPVGDFDVLDLVAEALQCPSDALDRRPDLRVEDRGGAAVGDVEGDPDRASGRGPVRRGEEGLGRRRRAMPVAVVAAAEHVEEQRGVADGAGERADDGEPVEGLGVGPGRDPSALGLDPDQVGPGGGDADRAGPVGADRGRRRDRRRPPPRPRRRSRRGCGRGSTGCG